MALKPPLFHAWASAVSVYTLVSVVERWERSGKTFKAEQKYRFRSVNFVH